MAEIVKPVNTDSYPLDGSRILLQGETEYVAIGPEEVEKLPIQQKKGILKLKPSRPLSAFINTNGGTVIFTQGDAPIVATVDQKGKVKRIVKWL